VNEPTLALAGCGRWGSILAGAAARAGIEVVSASDPDPAARRRFRRRFPSVPVYDRIDALLDDARVDALVIATPVGDHYETARAAIEAGKHVWVEKPLATGLEEASDLVRRAAKASRTLFVDHTFLYSPTVVALRKLLSGGAAGRPLCADLYHATFGAVRVGTSVLWELSPHDVAVAAWTLGRPVSVLAQAASWITPGVHDRVTLELLLDSGATAYATSTWAAPRKVRRGTVSCSRGAVEYEEGPSRSRLWLHRSYPLPGETGDRDVKLVRGGTRSVPLEDREPLVEAFREFVAATRGGSARGGPELALAVVATLEAAERSLGSGRPEEVKGYDV